MLSLSESFGDRPKLPSFAMEVVTGTGTNKARQLQNLDTKIAKHLPAHAKVGTCRMSLVPGA